MVPQYSVSSSGGEMRMSIPSTGLGHDDKFVVARPGKKQEATRIAIKYAPLPDWYAISGMRRNSTYEALARGDLKAKKLGTRTLIDVEHGLAYLATLPEVKLTTGLRRRAKREAAAAARAPRKRGRPARSKSINADAPIAETASAGD